MAIYTTRTIRIAAALINDEKGRLLLVRKVGTEWFMQAGGKIESGETPLSALARELKEEIGLAIEGNDSVRHIARCTARAANEPDHMVEAEIYHVRVSYSPTVGAEIEEAIWVTAEQAQAMPLAALTRDHILPLAQTL